jgi:hypothetical protein
MTGHCEGFKPPALFEGAKVLQYGRKDKRVRKGDDYLTYEPVEADQQIDYQTQQQHRGDGEVKSDILPLNPDVSGQSSNPSEPISGKVPDQPCQRHPCAYEHDQFACLLFHRGYLTSVSKYPLFIQQNGMDGVNK